MGVGHSTSTFLLSSSSREYSLQGADLQCFSTVYDEPQVYKYAVRYVFETTGPLQPITSNLSTSESSPLFEYEPFDPRIPSNPFYLPWALRGILEDQQIRSLFADDLDSLRSEFERWNPKTKPLQQVRMALEPLRGLPRPRDTNQEIPEAAETGKDPSKAGLSKL